MPWAVSLIFPSWRIMNFPSECSGRIFPSVSCPAGSSPPDGGMKRDSRHSPCGRCIVCDAFTVRVWPLRKLPEDTKISDKEKTTGYHLVSCLFYRKATISLYNAQCDHGIHWSVQRGKTEGRNAMISICAIIYFSFAIFSVLAITINLSLSCSGA